MGNKGSGWQEAIARLAGEKTRAETSATVVRRHGDTAAVSRAELTYGEAKAELDAVIAGLATALTEGQRPVGLADLEDRLKRGVDLRERLSREAEALVAVEPGTRSAIVALLVAVLPALIEAAATLADAALDRDRLRREAIRAQLEAQRWRDFAALAAAG